MSMANKKFPVQMEHWERPWPTKNCAYNINMRTNEAKYNRELLRVDKENKSLERGYKQNIRKLNAAQRGIISLLGHRPYHQIDREEVLFEYNHPGFCYKRNGDPRRFASLLESRTRKIVHDLEGKEGLFKKPASNIISDSPIMAEILSSPNIVEILCDLRTTSVFISDPNLFAQFSNTLMNSPNNPLPNDGENPMECLVQYRNNLIKEFFDAFRIQMEIRRCSGQAAIPTLNYYLNIEEGQGSARTPLDLTHLSLHSNNKEWSDAVIKRLEAAKLEEDRLREGEQSAEGTQAEEMPILDMSTVAGFTMLVNAEDNLKMTPSNELKSTPTNLKIKTNNTAVLGGASMTVNVNVPGPEVPGSGKSPMSPYVSWSRRSGTNTTSSTSGHSSKPKRNEFDRFVKNLVLEVEKIAEIGKNMGQLQKRKQQSDTVNKPLVRLLRKKSLFSSLTEDDLLFYEYDGGRRDAEIKIARGLNLNQPRLGGFTFHVPSRNPVNEAVENLSGGETNNNNEESLTKTRHTASLKIQSTTINNNNNSSKIINNGNPANYNNIQYNRPSSKSARVSTAPTVTSLTEKSRVSLSACQTEGSCLRHRSLKRLCCEACNAKLRAKCDEAQDRDRKDRLTAEQISWKLAGLSKGWTKNSKRDTKAQHLLSSIPLSLRRNYSRISSGFGSPLSNNESGGPTGRHRVPTPAGQRKNLFPEVNKFISKFQLPASREGGSQGINSKSIALSKATNSNNNSSKVVSRSRTGATTGRESPTGKPALEDDPDLDSWTLKVDRMDIMKLRHELETEVVREKLAHLESYFNPHGSSPKSGR